MTNRYKEYWISKMEKGDPIFFSEKEVEDYVKMFPRGTKVIMEKIVIDCCNEGHTFREIMRYDEFEH